MKTSARFQKLHAQVRALSPTIETDRYWADEMAALQAAVLPEMSPSEPEVQSARVHSCDLQIIRPTMHPVTLS